MLDRRASASISADASIGADIHGPRMDRIYRHQRHIYDISRKYYLLGRDRLIADLAADGDMRVLEVGCGTGRNLIAAARRWPKARFYGFDISMAMLETAQGSIARARLPQRIGLTRGDATDFDADRLFGTAGFERVFLSYTLSMIPGWELAIDAALRALAPGGQLHIVDFGQQERLPAAFRDALFGWLARFEVSPRGELRAVLEDMAARHRLRLDFASRYRGYSWRATLSR